MRGSNTSLIVRVRRRRRVAGLGESCTRCVPVKSSPALFKAKVAYLSGIRKINHAEPVLGYAFAV